MKAMAQKDRWEAVLAGDKRFDGAFVYGVRSTGIYCRPSCSARRGSSFLVTERYGKMAASVAIAGAWSKRKRSWKKSEAKLW